MTALPARPRVTSYAKQWTKALEAEFAKRTKRAAEVVRAQVRQNLGRAGAGRHSKPGEYPRRQSGRLQRGVRTRQKTGQPNTFQIYNTAPYAGFLEYDTKGGTVIVPKRARALAWRAWAGRKKVQVFAARVVQGAIKGRSFERRTLAECRTKIAAIYTRGLGPEFKRTGNAARVRIG